MIGMEVVTEDGEAFGTLKDVIVITPTCNKSLPSISFLRLLCHKERQTPFLRSVPLRPAGGLIADMIGMEVVTEDGEAFGTLKDVIGTGANDVYVVESLRYGDYRSLQT